jgi:hypothetical protein
VLVQPRAHPLPTGHGVTVWRRGYRGAAQPMVGSRMSVNLEVGVGDERERAEASHDAVARLYDSVTGAFDGSVERGTGT